MLAMARHIPQASASTRAGKWEKKKFMGNELRGKTLGIIGLGSIGREVVKRARAFEMRIVAHDPYVTSQDRRGPGRGAGGSRRALRGRATTSPCTWPPRRKRERIISREAFAQMKPGVRIVNCARGELVDEAALAEALAGRQSGRRRPGRVRHRAAARRLSAASHDAVLATPHIGGSTEEAQEIVGVRIAEQVVEYLKNGVAINAVNMPALSPEQYRAAGPVHHAGRAAGQFRGAHRLRQSAQRAAGLLRPHRQRQYQPAAQRRAGRACCAVPPSRKANLVNAMQIAEQRGWELVERPRKALRPHRFHPSGTRDRQRRHHAWKARCCWTSRA